MNAPTKIRSVFSTEPIKRPDGSTLIIDKPTTSDDRKLEALARFEVLTIPYLAALVGENPIYVRQRVRELRAEPNSWIKMHDSQMNDQKHSRLDEKGWELSYKAQVYLRDKGIHINDAEFTGPFFHQLMSAQVRADFDFGAMKTPDVRIISFHDMLADPRLPKITKSLANPHLFPATLEGSKSRPVSRNVRFDCFPFLVERANASKPYHLVLGMEIDRGTERLRTYSAYRAYIKTKIYEDIAILNSGVAKERFGFPNGYIIYVSPSATRLSNIKEVATEALAEKPSLGKYLLFHLHPDSTDNPIPTGQMLTSDYERVGHDPFNFLK